MIHVLDALWIQYNFRTSTQADGAEELLCCAAQQHSCSRDGHSGWGKQKLTMLTTGLQDRPAVNSDILTITHVHIEKLSL